MQGGISGFRLMTLIAANLLQRPARVKKIADSINREYIESTETIGTFKILICLLLCI